MSPPKETKEEMDFIEETLFLINNESRANYACNLFRLALVPPSPRYMQLLFIYIYKFIYFFRASYHQTLLQVKSRSPFLPRLVTRNRILNVSGYVRDWHFKCLGVMLYVSVPKV